MKTPDTTLPQNEGISGLEGVAKSVTVEDQKKLDALYQVPEMPQRSEQDMEQIKASLEKIQKEPVRSVEVPFSGKNELAEHAIDKSLTEMQEVKAEQSVKTAKTFLGVSLAGTTLGAGLGIGALVLGATAAAPVAFGFAGIGVVAMAASALYKKAAESRWSKATDKRTEINRYA